MLGQEQERRKALDNFMDQLKEKEYTLSEASEYKERYMELFQRVLESFTKFHSHF